MEAAAQLMATASRASVRKCTRDKLVRFIRMPAITDHARTVVLVQQPTPEPATCARVATAIQELPVEHVRKIHQVNLV